MSDRPLASILINNYNYGAFLGEAIDSALNQSYPNTEVIVVDDGSTDNSREIIAGYGERIIPVLKANGGQASAFNAGFAASSGEIICFLDSDDMCLPEKVAETVKAFGDREDWGWCFHNMLVFDADTETSASPTPNDSSLQEYDLRADLQKGKLKGKLKFTPPTSGLCFRRSLLKQILPMPEAKGVFLSDGYLEWPAFALSKGILLDKPLGVYRIHNANAYARNKEEQKRKAKILTTTGYWLRIKFPSISQYADNLVGAGLGLDWRLGALDPETRKLLKEHLASVTILEKLDIYLRAIYTSLKTPG